MAVMFQKMVMAGVGLICGSLALDMRRRKLVKEIVGYGRSEGNLRTGQEETASSTVIFYAAKNFLPASIS